VQTLKQKFKLEEKRALKSLYEKNNPSKKAITNRNIALVEEKLEFESKRRLVEALKNYDEVTNAITKLTSIKNALGNSAPSITSAIDTAAKEINSYSGGSFLERMKDKAMPGDIFKLPPLKNPIVRGLKLVDSLKSCFKNLPDILKNNVGEEILKKSADSKLEEIIPEDMQKNILGAIKKSLEPGGLFKSIPFTMNLQSLVDDVLGLTVNQVSELVKVVAAINPPDDPALLQADDKDKDKKEKDAQSPDQQKQAIVALQNAAKEAGISEQETVQRYLTKIVGWTEGIKNPNASVAIEALKDIAVQAKVAKGQLDGFVDGLAIDQKAFLARVNKDIEAKIKEEEEKKKKEAEAGGKPGAPGAPAAT